MNDENDFAVKNGFESISELRKMVGGFDLSNRSNIGAFRVWQLFDGTKKGLIRLTDESKGEK